PSDEAAGVRPSKKPSGSGVEPGRTGMVRLEVGETGRGRADRGHRGLLSAIRPADRADFSDYPFDLGIRPVSHTCSGKPGEVADDEVDAHLGNPDWDD